MCKKIFIAATGQHCGKTTTSLSLLHLARKQYRRVGFIKPFGPKRTCYQGRDMDVDAALMASVYDMDADLEFMSPVVLQGSTTREVLDGKVDPQAYLDTICRATATLEQRCDFLIVEGAGHAGVGAVIGLDNARLAKQLEAPVLMVASGGVGNPIDAIHLNLALYREAGAEVRLLMPNKLIRSKRDTNLHYLQRAFHGSGMQIIGGFNYSPVLANPTLRHLSALLDLPLQADENQARQIVHNVQLGAASTQRVVDLLLDSTLLVVTSSRDEVLVMLATLYHLPEFKQKIAGLVIVGVAPLAEIVKRVLDDARIPYIRSQQTTAEVYTRIQEDVAKISADDQEKIALVQELAETELCFAKIDAIF